MVHQQTRLDSHLWVLLLGAANRSQVAVVGINDERPTLYSDATSHLRLSCDANSVLITCPGEHSCT